ELRIVDPREATPDLFEAIRMVRTELDSRQVVIGFAGGPFTVASYMIEGGPTKDFAHTKGLLYGEPARWHRLMETLTEVTIRYLRAQVDAGAQVVQLFDSWAGALSRDAYEAHVLPYSTRIFRALRDSDTPTIHFSTNTAHLLEVMAGAGSDVISVDWRIPLDEAWTRVGAHLGIQGNLEPAALIGSFDVGASEARTVPGTPWTDHEYLTQLLFYGLQRVGGLLAVSIVFGAITWAGFWLIYARIRQMTYAPAVAGLGLFLGAAAGFPLWGPRPQMFDVLFISLVLLIIERFLAVRSRAIFTLPLVVLIWA